MIDGVVSTLWDATSGAIPSPAWVEAITALRPAAPLAIRASLAADSADRLDLGAIRQGLQAYWSAGHAVYPVLEQGMSRYHELPGQTADPTLRPNAPLGFAGNPLLNDWINRYSLTACSVLRQIGPGAGIEGCFVANEPNLCALDLAPGAVPPPDKASALAPEVFGALVWTTASRLRAEVPWLTTIWPAAFSQLVWFFAGDGSNTPWFRLYWQRAVRYLQRCGKRPPWPWDGLCVNLEGAIGHPLPGGHATYCQYVAYELATTKADLGIAGGSVCGEWGMPAGNLDVPAMTGAWQALQASPFAAAFYFLMPAMAPGSYGALDWSIQQGQMLPGAPTPWYHLLQTFYSGA